MLNNEIERIIQEMRDAISKYAADDDAEKAESTIRTLARIHYRYNQYYTDEICEKVLRVLADRCPRREREISSRDKRTIVFYDNFALDLRGLAYIYIKALGDLGYKIIYIVTSANEWDAPHLKSLLVKYNAEIHVIPRFPLEIIRNQIVEIIMESKAYAAFLYTTPWDTAGILAFMQLSEIVKRYLINLTDHTFWLGVDALDICINFREYGKYICEKHRGIPEQKNVVLLYYPAVGELVGFKGFPFKNNTDQVVVFSGGALYKTFDENRTYYRIVQNLLGENENLIFWYAGAGDTTELEALSKNYPGRVFHTTERKDLQMVMENVDIYLSTYPMIGGLMSQYAVMGGLVPMTLVHDDCAYGIVPDEVETVSYFSGEIEFRKELNHMIREKAYRDERNLVAKRVGFSSDDFKDKLRDILEDRNRVVYKSREYDDGKFLDAFDTYDLKELRKDCKWIGQNDFLYEVLPELRCN